MKIYGNPNVRYSGGILRIRDDGRIQADYARNGRRVRRTFDTQEAAKEWLEGIHLYRTAKIPDPTLDDVIDAHVARAILPDGVTLRDAAVFFVRHTGPSTQERKVEGTR